MIITASSEIIPNENEIKQVLTDIHSVDDDHKYVNDAIERLDYDKSIGLSRIIELASKSEKWYDYVQPIRKWLQQHIECI